MRFGAAQQAAAAAESAKRIDALRQRLEQYNAAISRAMGMQGVAAHPDADSDDDDEEEYTEETDETDLSEEEEDPRGAAFDVENYIRQFHQFAEKPSTTSRPLFPEGYRDGSTVVQEADGDSDDDYDTEEEEEEVSEGEVGQRVGGATIPPWLRGAVFPTPKNVDRCLSSELRQAAASIQPANPPAVTNPLDDTVLSGVGADAMRVSSPTPDEPSYSFRDLENAYHRISKIDQSVKRLSAFGMLEPKLPFADRIQQLREERVRLLAEDSDAASESRELQRMVLPKLADSDVEVHHEMQAVLHSCRTEVRYRAVHDKKQIIELKQAELTDKVRRMQDTFSHLQRKKQLTTSSDAHNAEEAIRLAEGAAALKRDEAEIERLEKESATRAEETAALQAKVDNWMAVLKDREHGLDERGSKMQLLGEQLQRRKDTIVSHKENRHPR